ncbi:MAG: peptide chain release factor N(5)-glutamine methyltransferase [Plesiomonas sp.]
MRTDEWLQETTERLQCAGSESARRDAEILFGHVTGKSRSFLLAFPEHVLSAPQCQQLDVLVRRREQGEPIAYVIGEREFWSLPLRVSPATLIPRPDTERLVEEALNRLPASQGEILDLGTGTGAIALALASERPDCQITGIDLQLEAAALAASNAERLQIGNARFLTGSWFEPLRLENPRRQFVLIASNPPYIDADDPHLGQGDVRFEPRSALVADEQGLADIRLIAAQSREFLLPGGWLLVEHGWQQAPAVQAIFHAAGYQHVQTVQDYGGNDRVTLGCYAAVSA